jgi:hypothetical protein
MGSISSIPERISDNMRTMQEEMMVKQIERMVEMNLRVLETQMAFQFCKGRELFNWYFGF